MKCKAVLVLLITLYHLVYVIGGLVQPFLQIFINQIIFRKERWTITLRLINNN